MGNVSKQRDGTTTQKSEGNAKKSKKTLAEMKNDIDKHISRLDVAKESITELENLSIENFQPELQTDKRWKTKKKEDHIQELWDNYVK